MARIGSLPGRRTRLGLAIAVVAGAAAVAAAAPRRPAPRKPAPAVGSAARPASATAELDRLNDEYNALSARQAYFAAARVARRAWELQVAATGLASAKALDRMRTLATALGQIGDYRGEMVLEEQRLAATEKLYGAESREVLDVLSSLYALYWYWQDSRHAELDAVTQRAIAITGKLDGEHSLAYARQLAYRGLFLSARRRFAEAGQVYERSVEIEQAAGQNAGLLVGSLENVAMMYWQANQRDKALAWFERAIAQTGKPGVDPRIRSGALWTIASYYRLGGRDDLAQPLTEKIVEQYRAELAQLGPDDAQRTALLGAMAWTYLQAGDPARAEPVFTEAIALERKRGAAQSQWAGLLAETERRLGKPREALALLEHERDAALAAARAAPDQAARQDATFYNPVIAEVLRELRDFPRAERLLAERRAALEKAHGRRSGMYMGAALDSSYLYMASGKPAQAEQMLAEAFDIADRERRIVLESGTESDHAAYLANASYQLDLAINFGLRYAAGRGSAARLGLTAALRNKGRAIDAAAASLSAIRGRMSPADAQLLDELASARAQLARLTVAGPAAMGADDFARIQKLEISVGKASAAYRAASQPIALAAVQAAIPGDARLIEIVGFQPGDPVVPYTARRAPEPRRYAAYVVGRTGDPALVDLGPAAAIDEAVERFRTAVSDPDNDRAGELGHALYALTLGKLAPALGSASRVLIAPDGALNAVPFAALTDDRGELLIQRLAFTYLTSGRDLLRAAVKVRPRSAGAIFADPDFEVAAAPSGATARGQRSSDLRAEVWKRLPGTGQEADAIARQLRGAQLYRGGRATETALKAIHGPKVLHLATHGFFLADEAPAAAAAPAAPINPAPGARENPLLRSGLVLAGANHLASGDDDGIVTALEAAGLDLWGTQLVVLSACETGVGKLTHGDGVYGLRRALVIAGAESLVMSLWQVDDAATRDLMTGYYARLAAGASRSAALRDVQLALLRRPKYAHPYYWAAFLPAGDDAPLQ